MSTEDGPGLRTTVFFKGCPLKCAWCHNPESIPFKLDKEWIQSSCIFCLECVDICPNKAITFKDEKIMLDRDLCSLCMKCIDNCPTGALKIIGRDIEVDTLYKELIKDKAYFNNGGGITLSGGEVMLQTKEVLELLKLLKKDKIHIAIDTSGYIDFNKFEQILPFIDLILYDLKLDSSDLHMKYCGVENLLIKENLIKLNNQKKLWIRTPIIPDSTDSKENIIGISKFLKENNINFERWELCAFNNLCTDKYDRLYLDWPYKEKELITESKMKELLEAAKANLKSKNIYISGATKLEVRNE
jgi:pyruvate formate lyase activating enzyme